MECLPTFFCLPLATSVVIRFVKKTELSLTVSQGRDSEYQVSCLTCPSRAQSLPPNAIRIVIPGGAASPPDVVSRIVANELSEAESWRRDGGVSRAVAIATKRLEDQWAVAVGATMNGGSGEAPCCVGAAAH